MFIASGMLVVPSGQTYTPDQVAAATRLYTIARTTDRDTNRPRFAAEIASLQRRMGLNGPDGSPTAPDGKIGKTTAKVVATLYRPIPGIDISGVQMPTLNPQPGATPATTPAPASHGGPAPATAQGGTASAPAQGDEAARRAARELYDYVMRTSPAQRDRNLVQRLQTAIGVADDGKVGPETGNRVFELIGLRIPGTQGDARTSTATRTIVRSPSVVERSSDPSPDGSSIFSQAQGSLAGQDDVGAFFERNKVAIIATGAVILLGGVAAVYFATRED